MRTAAGAASLLGLLLAGCASGAGGRPQVPDELPSPAVQVRAPVLDDAAPVVEPPPAPRRDPILGSRWARDPRIAERTEYWRQIFSQRTPEDFTVFLERMGSYATLVDSALAAEGLPRSLRYLPIVESGYSPRAVSRASAVGLWQFMAPVARGYGMQVTPLVDERRDPVKSTLAAARYLKELQERFGSWFLALAAYNGGPSRVDRLLREQAPLAPLGDSLFLVLSPSLPRETREFVPKLLAAASVAERPERYGVSVPVGAAAYAFDEVEVPDATSLDVVAGAAGVTEDEVRELNPHILRGVTPRGRATVLRLPPGTGGAFAEAYAEIPPSERVTVTEHVVGRGETLSGIAQQYGVRVSELEAANPGVEPRRMQIGERLLVPLVPGAAAGRRASRVASAPVPSQGVHVVRSGESLWTIARRYGLTVSDLRSLNGLGAGAVLHPGDRIRLVEGA